MRKQNRSKQKIKDKVYQFFTIFSSSLSGIILLSIFMFMIVKGSSIINFDLLKNNYWSENMMIEVSNQDNIIQFEQPNGLSQDAYFSKKWGISLIDHITNEKQKIVIIDYIDPNSIFSNVKDVSIKTNPKDVKLEIGMQIEKIQYLSIDGKKQLTGSILKHNAKQMIEHLEKANTIQSLFIKTMGGGIRGSILATLYLLAISLGFALPIGICTAIYLNEYAAKNKWNQYIRNGIEMLTGVPSIVFGLLGVTVLFPITQIFHATTTSILLGGLTMSIILLPIVIRSCEEALIVVPIDLRNASLALGATQSQTIFKIVLPRAIPGILTGILLSVGRVIGESAALIYTMGTFISDYPSLLSQGTTLSVHIWSVMSGEQPNFQLASAISLIILIIVLSLNIFVKIISHYYTKKRS